LAVDQPGNGQAHAQQQQDQEQPEHYLHGSTGLTAALTATKGTPKEVSPLHEAMLSQEVCQAKKKGVVNSPQSDSVSAARAETMHASKLYIRRGEYLMWLTNQVV
jgi:hypothetical protein